MPEKLLCLFQRIPFLLGNASATITSWLGYVISLPGKKKTITASYLNVRYKKVIYTFIAFIDVHEYSCFWLIKVKMGGGG